MIQRGVAAVLLAQSASAAVVADVRAAKKDLGAPLELPTQFASTPTATAAEGAPHIVVFMVDDLGYGDVSFMQSDVEAAESLDTVASTPALNAMASKGIRLTSFYTSPTCTPSRASFMTGKYTTNLGLQDSVIHATEPRSLALDHTLLSEKLSSAGYRTLGVGKWHLGFHQPQYLPTARGFGDYFGILAGGGGHFSHQSSGEFTLRGPYQSATVNVVGYNLWHNGVPVTEADVNVAGKHSTTLYTDVALAQLKAHFASDEAANHPFFLYMAFQAVHAPMEVPEEFTDGTVPNGCAYIAADAETGSTARRSLCGMLSQLDQSAASLEKTLRSDALGNAWDSTVVVFLSDNGGIPEHGSSNYPFKGGKGTYYEGGVRVPCFLAGGFVNRALVSAGTTAGYATNSLVHVTDLHATLLGLAAVPFTTNPAPNSQYATTKTRRQLATSEEEANGAAVDLAEAVDGVDQWRYLIGGAEFATSTGGSAFAPRTSILHNLNSDAFGSGGALRIGDFKLVASPKVSEAEVYTYAQHVLQDGDFATSDLISVVGSKLLQQTAPSFSIFNVKKNPTERSDTTEVWSQDQACVDNGGAEACADLFGNEDYAPVQAALLNQWAAYRDISAPSEAVTFADDGPLADPALFGGYWMPWRDEMGVPYATYATSDQFAGKLDPVTGKPTDKMATDNGSSSSGSSSSGGVVGNGDGSGDKTWKSSKDLSAGQRGQGNTEEALLVRSAAAESSSSSSSSSSSPAFLVSGGAILGALGAVAVQAVLSRNASPPRKRESSYAAVRSEEA